MTIFVQIWYTTDCLFISTQHFNYMIAINLNAARNTQLDISQNQKRAWKVEEKKKHTRTHIETHRSFSLSLVDSNKTHPFKCKLSSYLTLAMRLFRKIQAETKQKARQKRFKRKKTHTHIAE